MAKRYLTCGVCEYFDDSKQECRKNAPTVHARSASYDRDSAVKAVWPIVSPDDWCSVGLIRVSAIDARHAKATRAENP